jgi:hypothetical protein
MTGGAENVSRNVGGHTAEGPQTQFESRAFEMFRS